MEQALQPAGMSTFFFGFGGFAGRFFRCGFFPFQGLFLFFFDLFYLRAQYCDNRKIYVGRYFDVIAQR